MVMDWMKRWLGLVLMASLFCGCARSRHPSLEEKAGQILMVGFRGETVGADSVVVRDIRTHHLGGVVLFRQDTGLGTPVRNIRSPEQLKWLTASLQQFAKNRLLIAIDQEGGRVNRLASECGFPKTNSHQTLGALDDPEQTYQQSRRMAKTLRKMGVNINFAPVVDLAVTPDNFIVKKERTFSDDPEVVVRHAGLFVRAHHDEGVLCALKHFPGHGSSRADSHWGLVDVTETWQPKELDPYRQLVGQTDLIMSAHVFHRNLDPDWPATLSRKIISGVLRGKLGYDGVVVSDDLGMKAIADLYGFETALEHALNAGVDLLLIANNTDYNPDVVPLAVQTIVHLVESGRVREGRLNEAYERVQRLRETIR